MKHEWLRGNAICPICKKRILPNKGYRIHKWKLLNIGIKVRVEYRGDEKHKTTLVHKKCFRKFFHTRRYREIGIKNRVRIFKQTWQSKMRTKSSQDDNYGSNSST